jgi:hypothetical protein
MYKNMVASLVDDTGAAVTVWQSGKGGLYVFNFFLRPHADTYEVYVVYEDGTTMTVPAIDLFTLNGDGFASNEISMKDAVDPDLTEVSYDDGDPEPLQLIKDAIAAGILPTHGTGVLIQTILLKCQGDHNTVIPRLFRIIFKGGFLHAQQKILRGALRAGVVIDHITRKHSCGRKRQLVAGRYLGYRRADSAGRAAARLQCRYATIRNLHAGAAALSQRNVEAGGYECRRRPGRAL